MWKLCQHHFGLQHCNMTAGWVGWGSRSLRWGLVHDSVLLEEVGDDRRADDVAGAVEVYVNVFAKPRGVVVPGSASDSEDKENSPTPPPHTHHPPTLPEHTHSSLARSHARAHTPNHPTPPTNTPTNTQTHTARGIQHSAPCMVVRVDGACAAVWPCVSALLCLPCRPQYRLRLVVSHQ